MNGSGNGADALAEAVQLNRHKLRVGVRMVRATGQWVGVMIDGPNGFAVIGAVNFTNAHADGVASNKEAA